MTSVDGVTDMSTEALWCRTEGHEWRWMHDETTVSSTGQLVEVRRQSVCRRCAAPRVRVIDVTSWSYGPAKITRYPDNYLVRGGRVGRSEVFREQFSRDPL